MASILFPRSSILFPKSSVLLWAMLKRRTKKRFRKLRLHNQREVVEVAQEEWEKLPWKRIYDIIDGMPRRVEAAINAEGERTKYKCMAVDGWQGFLVVVIGAHAFPYLCSASVPPRPATRVWFFIAQSGKCGVRLVCGPLLSFQKYPEWKLTCKFSQCRHYYGAVVPECGVGWVWMWLGGRWTGELFVALWGAVRS